jgi:hypothetical protein
LKRQPGSPSSSAWRIGAIIRKLNQAAFATADTPSVQERPNVLARWAGRLARRFGGAFSRESVNLLNVE